MSVNEIPSPRWLEEPHQTAYEEAARYEKFCEDHGLDPDDLVSEAAFDLWEGYPQW